MVAEPADAEEIAAIVARCERDKIPLAPIGSGRTLAQVRRQPVALAVSLARLNRVIAFEPDDMTVVVQAGVALGALNQLMANRGQRLPCDPSRPADVTIGSAIAAAASGPLRLSEGTIRDLLIGIQFVGHGGRQVRAGGRVVKNVAGYDLMKVMTGSFGTLGIVTEAAFKVRPTPPNYTLAIAGFDSIREAFAAAFSAAEAAPLAHCEVISRGLAGMPDYPGGHIVMAGFTGLQAAIDSQRDSLMTALGSAAHMVEELEAESHYARLRDVVFPDDSIVAQIAVLSADLPRCLEAAGVEFRAHAISGVAQLCHNGLDPAAAVTRWRELAHDLHGHLRVIAAPPAVRARLAMFDTPSASAMALMRRMKAAFDPRGIFNPGCFVGGL
jgi:glycolate oxidase FAD binding subunit